MTLVDGVDLRVRPGETVGLVGESGSGKTVTSLAIMGLLPPNARRRGEIVFEDRDLHTMSQRDLNALRGVRMAIIFQEPRRSLNPAFTVGDQVAESVRFHLGLSRKQAWDRALQLFDQVEIPNAARRLHEYPHEFSGGMCQRVMLAMALACEPRLLIADEPTTALDVTVQRQVLELIFSMQEHYELGVLLITHDLGVVAEVCDRTAVMYAGEIVEEAAVMDLFDQPGHPYTAALLQSMPDVKRHREQMGFIPGAVPAPQAYPSGCRFHPRCAFSEAQTCDVDRPAHRTVDAGHRVRCARVNEIELSGGPHD